MLERDVRELRAAVAELSTTLASTKATLDSFQLRLDKIEPAMQTLASTFAEYRGGWKTLLMIVFGSGSAGAIVTEAVRHIR